MNYKNFIKDLFFGLVIGSVLIVGFSLLVRPLNLEITKENETLKVKVAELEREVSHLKGEKSTYKRWVDSMIVSLNYEQKIDLIKKM